MPECLKRLLNISGNGSHIGNAKTLNEDDHSFSLCMIRVFVDKNAFGFCLQTDCMVYCFSLFFKLVNLRMYEFQSKTINIYIDRDFNFLILREFFDASSKKSCTEGRHTAKFLHPRENICVIAFV